MDPDTVGPSPWRYTDGWRDRDEFTPLYDQLVSEYTSARPSMKPVLAKGLDYSAGVLSGAAIKAAGYQFVVRYIDAPANIGRKHIHQAEYADLLKAGIQVLLVFEVGTADMLGGRAAGVANAKRALAGANWLGYNGPIFMACDMHLSQTQIQTAFAYMDGAISVLGPGRASVYGFWELIDACIATKRGAYFWQCGIAPDTTDAVHIWQRNNSLALVGGIQCDVNEMLIPIPFPTAPSEGAMPAINMGSWEQTGTAVHQHITCPVGPGFIYKSGWFSLSAGWADAPDVTVWFVGTVNGAADYLAAYGPFTLVQGVRQPLEIPPGTETISVEYTTDNPVGWSIELSA